MPKTKYKDINFRPEALARIKLCNEIIESYFRQGFDLTLRQLYYQLVSRTVIANTEREYKNLGNLVSDARLAGLIDWKRIVDRTRNVRANSHWDSPSDIIEACAQSYRRGLWDSQPVYCEVWIEKDALVGVIENKCRELDVPFFSCRGYTSQSEMWEASQRLIKNGVNKDRVQIFHLGDHDPSGKDMTRDITDRLTLFLGDDMPVERLALNWDQIEKYAPPPNPAKVTDSRAKAYIEEFGDESWELDALEPSVIETLIETAILGILDEELWEKSINRQESERSLLKSVSTKWDSVSKFVQKGSK